MRGFKNERGVIIYGFNNQKEYDFYENTTKRKMFLIIEQMANRLKDNDKQDFIDIANKELENIKIK